MCGICGELRFDNAPIKEGVLVSMRERLAHRGPDEAGLFVSEDRRAALGFRRLRVVDLLPRANQPMSNEDGAVRLVFNGEIYNFLELRRTLESRGHGFRSNSDTETIVHLYEEHGIDAFERLEGMFAVAVWDSRNRRLVLARDRAGKKPLFYYKNARHMVFASEIKSLMANPQVSIDIDPASVPAYLLHGYVPSPATPYRDIRQLPPATVMVIDFDGSTRHQVYWSLHYPDRDDRHSQRPPDRREAIARVRTLLTQAVERRLMADVPLGAFLSGGVDSTIVVGLMSQLTGSAVRTFSIGFEGDSLYDETEYAKLVANRFRTAHTEFRVTPSAVDLIDKLIWHHDGPFGDASAIPTFIVSKLTREHVTVVLTGDGGDELFAGYRRFHAALAAERIPKVGARAGAWLLGLFGAPARPRHPINDARRFLQAAQLPWLERMTRLSSIFYDELDDLLSARYRNSPESFDRLGYLCAERAAMSRLTGLGQLLHANFRSYLLDDLLVKTDRCTMANALEARSPFLDRELTEYVAQLPDDWKLGGAQTKVILREAFSDLVPPVVSKRKKMGFGVPLDTWFREELRDQLCDELLAPDACYRDFLEPSAVHGLVRRHLAGEAHAGLQLWTVFCFERWLRLLPSWRSSNLCSAEPGLKLSPC
jgi:asparagine synthase (glutamine-hydrolysing)